MEKVDTDQRIELKKPVKRMLEKHIAPNCNMDDYVIDIENFADLGKVDCHKADFKKAKQALYILLFALVNVEWKMKPTRLSRFHQEYS